MRNFCLLVSFISFIACERYPKELTLKTGKNEVARGKVFKDSLFHGLVKYYDTLNNYLGYSTFTFGLENGPAVRYSNNVVTDSLNFKNGMKDGFGYKYDLRGNLIYKSYLYKDRNVGSVYEYDPQGKVKVYYFVNFEGETIYQMKFVDTSVFERGSPINGKVFDRLEDGQTQKILFLYLISPPDRENHFEIAVLDSSKKIISSKRIRDTGFYSEVLLDTLAKGQRYAVVFHKYNNYKQRDDLEISEIK